MKRDPSSLSLVADYGAESSSEPGAGAGSGSDYSRPPDSISYSESCHGPGLGGAYHARDQLACDSR
eukprot:65702-Hanusia_phi.AAC.1